MNRMSSVAAELAALLSTVRRPGDFCTAGTIEIPAPGLEVDGVGAVALPLLPVQAEQLIAVAERAPYGRGEDTLVDTKVRRTWQIGADRVRIGSKHWARTLATILTRVAEGLGVDEPIVAELYKLLVYDRGSFFVSHRDTEKAPGMFATLVVVLPSTSTGGELVVRHKDREVRLGLHCEDPSEAAFAAFYADCVHEVLPVTSGCRLALVYNLLRRGKGRRPEPPNYEGEEVRVAALLQAWSAGKQAPQDDAPEKLIYPLEYAYTPAELGFDALKGADAAIAGVLAGAARQSGCDLHLALVSIEESGAAEYNADFYSPRRWSELDDEALEAGEVHDRFVHVSEWRRLDGTRSTLSTLPVDEDEISPPDAFDDMDPDEEEFHEATGNEGASFERTYQRAALVLWPRERLFAVLSQAGLPVTLPYLADLTEQWAASGEDRRPALWRQAHELSGHMLSDWPKQRWSSSDAAPSEAARMLTLLTRLADTERLDTFLSDIAPEGLSHKRDTPAIVGAVGLLPPHRAAALIERIIAGTAATSFGACGGLLARAVAGRPDGRDLHAAATVLVEALPGDPARAAPRSPWERGPDINPDFLVDLFTALGHIDAALAERAADHILAWPETYDLDSLLVPALRRLTGSGMNHSAAAVRRLRGACLAHLRARVAEPLEAPRDWTRASRLNCQCRRCGELSLFLADPQRKTWMFKAAEADRLHVENTIKQARCDLDVTTDRRGRPYSLVCTKNQASYERRMKQRKQDLADIDQLDR
jgi:predicted 2-oxoglutarate/Fe(II)-dependent dioxygenase YbiX